jgi:AcrR family transcriptional regulator
MKTSIKLGRPTAFDKDAALDVAMRLFWARGYEGTSMADLSHAMGVHPSSIYAAFGDKRALFALAAKWYSDVSVECMVKALRLQSGATTERRIRYATSRTINRHDTERCRIRRGGAINPSWWKDEFGISDDL